jgi:MFS family permease
MTSAAPIDAAASGTPLPPRALTHKQTMSIVLGSLLPVLMGSMAQSNVASALPTIGAAVGSTSNLSWIVTIYLLTQTASTPLYGKLSDIHGRRVVLLGALWIFLIGSLGCALSRNMPLLILFRAIQGLGAGGLTSVPLTILGDVAPPRLRPRYYTYFSLVYITAGAVGPAFGGFCAEYLDWTVIFWTNLPIGILGSFVTGRALKRLPRYEQPARLDFAGAALIMAASGTTMFVLNAGGKTYPWAAPELLGLAALSACLWVGFVARMLSAAVPLIPLMVIRNKIVRMATIANGLGWGGVMALNIYLPMYLQSVHRVAPAQSGLALMLFMTTVNIAALVGSVLTGRLEHYKRPAVAGMCLCLVATLVLAYRATAMGLIEFQVLTALIGLGFGPAAPITTVAMQNAVPLHQLGTTGGAMAFSRGLFTTLIAAAFGAVILGPGTSLAPADAAGIAAAAHSFQLVFYAAAFILALALVALVAMEERPLSPGRVE